MKDLAFTLGVIGGIFALVLAFLFGVIQLADYSANKINEPITCTK